MPDSIETTTPDGARLRVQRTTSTNPKAKTILLISGLGGTAGFWKPVIGTMHPEYELIGFDQRGIGASSRGQATVNITQLARDSLHVMDALGIERCTVIGHSTGGCIAQELAMLAPDRISALVLSATWLKADPYVQSLFVHRRALLMQNPAAYAGLGAIMSYAPQWLSAHWTVYEAAMRQVPDTTEAQTIIGERIDALLAYDGTAIIPHIACPTLVVGSADDAIIPFTGQIVLHDALQNHAQGGARQARLHDFGHGGHFYPVSRTDDFCKTVTHWLGSQT